MNRRRRWLPLAVALALAGSVGTAAAQATLAPGQIAPDFSLDGREGGKVALAALHGRPVLLHFWASWCPVCQQAFPWYNGLQQRYGARGLQVLGIAVDRHRGEADAFLREHPAEFTVAYDAADRVPRSYDVRAMPMLVLIAADGKVSRIDQGLQPSDQAAVERAIQALLAGH